MSISNRARCVDVFRHGTPASHLSRSTNDVVSDLPRKQETPWQTLAKAPGGRRSGTVSKTTRNNLDIIFLESPYRYTLW